MSLTHQLISHGGWENNLKISNQSAELILTLDVGPRILHFGPLGGANVFEVFDEQLGGVEEEEWQIRGGHRLWLAPEGFPYSYYPDNYAVDHHVFPNGSVTVAAPEEMPQGFIKEMDISLHPDLPRVRVVHRLTNIVDQDQDISVWALSVMAAGGVSIVPQTPVKGHPGLGPGDFVPDRNVVLWNFTNLSDPRYYLGTRYITLSQDSGLGPTKIGLNHAPGWSAYWKNGTLFVKRFGYVAGATYPDRNSSYETYTDKRILEMESLSPLITLGPGKVVEHVEEWELFTGVPAFDPRDDESIARALSGLELGGL